MRLCTKYSTLWLMALCLFCTQLSLAQLLGDSIKSNLLPAGLTTANTVPITISRCELDSSEARIAQGMEDFRQARKAAAKQKKKQNKKTKKGRAVAPKLYELRIIFHVIMSTDGSEGFVPLDSLVANMDSANKVFAGLSSSRGRGPESSIRVVLAGVTYTNNSEWFYMCSDYASASRMKFSTALSAATTVNVWTCHSTTRLGWVNYLPYELAQFSVWNGLNLNYKGLPPSKTSPERTATFLSDYSDGDTFTHELGHYLGLLHTFGNGVTGCDIGDNVDDTPAEASPAPPKACHESPARNTCLNRPGSDPVWNIMDYADDTCAEEFTKGQIEVMRYSIEQYKPLLLNNEPLRCVADGNRGPSPKLTICKSECFLDKVAPDGRAAPSQGWCRTDSAGSWGACCCGNSCIPRPSVSTSQSLTCAKVQEREETIQYGGERTQCLTASIFGSSREAQVYTTTCGISEFKRWAFNYDGGIISIGTGLCLAVQDTGTDLSNLEGKRVLLEPCVAQKPNQKWLALPAQKKAVGVLTLFGSKSFCLELSSGFLIMKKCDPGLATQDWLRASRPNCGSLKKLAACRSSAVTLGCSCRWVKKRCVS